MNQPYTIWLEDIAKGQAPWGSDDIRYLLLSSASTYVFNASHRFVADVLTNGGAEPVDVDYARTVVPGRTVTPAGSTINLAAAAGTMSPGPTVGTAVAAVVYEHVTDDDDSRLVAYLDDGFPAVFTGDPFELAFTGGVAATLSP